MRTDGYAAKKLQRSGCWVWEKNNNKKNKGLHLFVIHGEIFCLEPERWCITMDTRQEEKHRDVLYFCSLVDNWRSLTTWVGKKMNKKKYFQIVFSGMNPRQSESLEWDASCSKAKCEEMTVVCWGKKEFARRLSFPMHLYQALQINLNVSKTAAAKSRLPAKSFLSVLPSLPPSLQKCFLSSGASWTRTTPKSFWRPNPRHNCRLGRFFFRSCCSTPSSKEQAAAKSESPSLIGREI